LKREYSEETTPSKQDNSKTSSNFLWLAGTGGFFGALIYYLGQPEEDSKDAVCLSLQKSVVFLHF
jgi:hypothetical protein